VGITRETELISQLEEGRGNCTRALKFYADGNWTKATYYVDMTLDTVAGPLVHQGYANIHESDFTYTPPSEVQRGN